MDAENWGRICANEVRIMTDTKKPLNTDNEICRRCNRPTIPLFHSNKMRYCPNCESDNKKNSDEDLYTLDIDPEKK